MAAPFLIPPITGNATIAISPTDVSQFIRLDQCQRYLRLRLQERQAGADFLRDADVAPQSIPPILTRSGARFEADVAADISQHHPVTVFSAEMRTLNGTTSDNDAVVAAAAALGPGKVAVLLQPRLEAPLGRWHLRGDIDLLRLERDAEAKLHLLIADMKSSTSAKVEHRLQVAFYHDMLQAILKDANVRHEPIELGILYRGSATSQEDSETLAANLDVARELLGTEAGYLELVEDASAYLSAVDDLVLGEGSVASRLLGQDFEAIPFHLTYKCDGCLYNEFCLKEAARTDDLSLIPYLQDGEKTVLASRGITTTRELASLKEIQRHGTEMVDGTPQDAITLVPAAGNQSLTRELATTWPVGPRLDELIHRAKRYQAGFVDSSVDYISYIPHKGYGTLPVHDDEQHPNLVLIHVDVQHDYLQDRLYLLGALVVGHEHGETSPERHRSIVRLAETPPDSDEVEAELLREWIADVLQAIVEVAAPDAEGEPNAPIHLVFFNEFAQRLLLDACSRHMREILGATAIYDFVTQLAAYDSPVATLLETQIREQKNYPMLCQSLQSVANSLKFQWDDGVPYRQLFRERLFDYMGADNDEETGERRWYTRRSRFNSQIPLEYAYAAWDQLPEPSQAGKDDFASYREVTPEILTGFQARRLDAIEHIAGTFRGNRQTTLTPFDLSVLGSFQDVAPTLAHALHEFVMIERHVELAAWKRDHLAPPELRMLRGQSLVVHYREEDQSEEFVAKNRENLQRYRQREAWRAAHPDAEMPKEVRDDVRWSQEGLRVRLLVSTPNDLASLDDIRRLSDLKEGAMLLLADRFSIDGRLPEDEQAPFTTTVKQLFRARRATLVGWETEKENGRIVRAWAVVELNGGGRGNPHMGPFGFHGHDRPLEPGVLLTLDEDPNDFPGYWAHKVTAGLIEESGKNRLYQLLTEWPWTDVAHPAAFIDGQQRFLAGLDALAEFDPRYGFEPGKRRFIGEHTLDPLLLVQGPPGTGKSYSTAFALLARLQGALAADIEFRILISCKTHAAIDVLLHNVNDTIATLGRLRDQYPDLFARFFDDRLLDISLIRYRPRGSVQPGITPVPRDRDREKGTPKAIDRIKAARQAIVAATPGAIYGLVNDQKGKLGLFGHEFVQCLVLDEASQMDLPNAIMAALPLAMTGQIIVVGDHRQMPPIIHNDWDNEPRRTFKEFQAYQSLFETLLTFNPPVVRFEESFRLHADMAEFLRRVIYVKDGIRYHSNRRDRLGQTSTGDSFVQAVLDPAHPLVVIVHDETASQLQNEFELNLMRPILAELTDPAGLGLDADEGFGVVVPHRAQRAAIADQISDVRFLNPDTGDVEVIAVDTVERYQGGERTVMVYSATESDRDYLVRSSRFLMDPRRLNVALSRAKRKLIVIAARSVFELFSADEETFQNAQLWKNLLRETCVMPLWEGERHGHQVEVWGNPATVPSSPANGSSS